MRGAAAAAGLVVALAVGPATLAAARTDAPAAVNPKGPCRLLRGSSETAPHYARRVITCATGRWLVPGGAERAICIAARESGLVPTASSPGGHYLGLYQHSAKAWPSRYKRWAWSGWRLGTSALNGRTNTIVTIRMVNGLGGWTAAGWPVRHC